MAEEGAEPEEGEVESKEPWRPIIAALLSVVFAGLGHLFLRQYVRAGIFLLLAAFLYRISGYSPRAEMLNMVLFVVAAFDAFSFGKRGHGIF